MSGHVVSTGFNTRPVEGSVDALELQLAHMAAIGCTGCEITAVGLDAVVSNRLIPGQVKAVRTAMARFPFNYSMHAPIAINLMDETHRDLHRRAAMVSLDLAAEIGAPLVVLHPGRCAPRDWIENHADLLARERDLLRDVADHARSLGVRIAYENISPNPRVISGLETSYSLDPAQLAQQLEALEHSAVIACLDISHAQQGAVLWGFDMIESCMRLAPHIGHIHYSDSTGIPATIASRDMGETHFFGLGDMHAPPGMGAVDFETLGRRLTVLPDTRLVIEIKSNFKAHSEAMTLAEAKQFAARINGEPT